MAARKAGPGRPGSRLPATPAPHRSAALHAGDRIERGGGVAHAAAQHAIARHAAPCLAARRPQGHQAAAGLQAEDAAARRRNADRPAAVAAVGQGHHAGGDRDGGAAAGAAGRTLRRPGVAGGPAVDERLGGGRHAQRRHGGAGKGQQAGGVEAFHQHGVAGKTHVLHSASPMLEGRRSQARPESFNRNGRPPNTPVGRQAAARASAAS